MSPQLNIVFTDPRLLKKERHEQGVRAIGEILPYVLAKYGIAKNGIDSVPAICINTPQFSTTHSEVDRDQADQIGCGSATM